MRKIISLLLVFLFITSVSIPTASAQAAPAVGIGIAAAAPETAEIVIAGITVVMSGAAIVEFGKNVGIFWDGATKTWDRFLKDVSAKIHKNHQWIGARTPVGGAILKTVCEAAPPAGSGKKDDKWYFEARKHNGRIEIKSEALNEEQALKEMGRGKHIMTVNKNLARDLINRFNGKALENAVGFEKHPRGKLGKEDFYEHANFEAKNQRCHVWVWEP